MRNFPRPSRDEGFTLVEVLVTMAVISVVGTAAMAVATSTMQSTLTVTDRRDVFADGRFALDQLAEDLRQAESIDASSDADTVTVPTYVNGTAATVVWRVTGGGAPYELQRSVDGGPYATLVGSLASDQMFTYTAHEGTRDQVSIVMTMETRTSSVDLVTDVYLRNA